jgi:hypothetical protein
LATTQGNTSGDYRIDKDIYLVEYHSNWVELFADAEEEIPKDLLPEKGPMVRMTIHDRNPCHAHTYELWIISLNHIVHGIIQLNSLVRSAQNITLKGIFNLFLQSSISFYNLY